MLDISLIGMEFMALASMVGRRRWAAEAAAVTVCGMSFGGVSSVTDNIYGCVCRLFEQ